MHVAAIAGASSGIGRAMAVHFAAQGYRVSLCARREQLLAETQAASKLHFDGSLGGEFEVAVLQLADDVYIVGAFGQALSATGTGLGIDA